MPPEEMFTVIHHKKNVAADHADNLKNQNQKAEPAGSGSNAGQAKLACSSHFFVGLGVSCFLRCRGVKLW